MSGLCGLPSGFGEAQVSKALSGLMARGLVGTTVMKSAETGRMMVFYHHVFSPEFADMTDANVLCNACGRRAGEANKAGICRKCAGRGIPPK